MKSIVPCQRSLQVDLALDQFAQVGEVASSKSAMNTFAPELSALMIILRSAGPVISTRRSSRSAGIGATVQSPSRMSRRLGQEVGQLARIEALLPLAAQRQQAPARAVEAAVQLGEEVQRGRAQDLVDARSTCAPRIAAADGSAAAAAADMDGLSGRRHQFWHPPRYAAQGEMRGSGFFGRGPGFLREPGRGGGTRPCAGPRTDSSPKTRRLAGVGCGAGGNGSLR